MQSPRSPAGRTRHGSARRASGTEESHAYDTADRLLDTGILYGPFGDTEALPGSDAGGEELQSFFYSDGQVAQQMQKEPPIVKGEAEKAQTIGYTLDPARRILETVSTGTVTRNEVSHYDGPGTSPAWLSYPPTSEWTRMISGIRGGLVAEQFNTEAPVIEIANLHGDIVGTVSTSETATKPSTMEDGEFGVPSASSPGKYKWLGAGEFPTELPSGVIAMGARSYVPQIGRFLQPDPSPSGSANAYAYTYGDPLNESDPSGEYPVWLSGGYVGEGEGLHGEGAGFEGVGVGEGSLGAIAPPTAQEQEEEAYEEYALDDVAGAGSEEFEEFGEEEGEYEGVAYHPGSGGQEEGHIEEGLLYQPLPESSGEAQAGVRGGVGKLCQSPYRAGKTSEACARYASLWGEITRAWHWVKHHVHKLVATAIAGVSTLVIGATGALATSLCGLAAGEDPLTAFDCYKIGSLSLAAFGGGVAATVDAWKGTKN